MCQTGARQNKITPERKCGGRDVIYAVSVAFTDRGRLLSRKAEDACRRRADREILWRDLTEIDEETFRNADVIFFFCASGIAVRKIAPFLADKTSDPAVLVIGEEGSYVISLLSGHLGGANRWTREIAGILGAQPVITTATDGRKLPSIDLWASKCGLSIDDIKLAKRVTAYLLKENSESGCLETADFPYLFDRPDSRCSSAEASLLPAAARKIASALRNERVGEEVSSSGFSDKEYGRAGERAQYAICITENLQLFSGENTLILRPKRCVLGVGCRRGTDAGKMREFIFEFLKQNGIDPRLVERICSIDRKKDEACIKTAARALNVPFTVFSAEELAAVPGSFSRSDFVEETVGIDNVCERAAVCGAGPESRLIVKKTIADGMTAAAALRPPLTEDSLILTPEEWLKTASGQIEDIES